MSNLSMGNYCIKIKGLKLTDVNELNQILDELNSMSSFDASDETEAIGDLLCTLVKGIPSGNDHMLCKYCCLLNFWIKKQKLLLHKANIECICEFLIMSLQSCGEWAQSDVLIALAAVLDENVNNILKLLDCLIGENGVLINILVSGNQDKSVQYNVFQCLLNIVKNSEENSLCAEYLDLCYQKCLLVLKNQLVCSTPDGLSLKILIISLKCLQHILTSKNLALANVGELLGTLKSILFYGLPGQTLVADINLFPTLRCPVTSYNQESQSESDSTYAKLRKQKKNKRKRRNAQQKKQSQTVTSQEEDSECTAVDLTSGIGNSFSASINKTFSEIKIRSSSSDSELSDAENHISRIKALQASSRQNAYLALQAVIKTLDRNIMFGYWSSFLPDHPAMPGIVNTQTIFTTILKDPVPQVRLCALTLLAEILRGSKQFLIHADGRNARHMSFTSLSSILASMISEIHRCLLLTLLAENSPILLTQIIKCYAVLCENVPYSKLSKEMPFKFLKHVKSFIFHKDIQVQVACFTVFTSIISSDQTPPEIEELMLSPDFDSVINVVNEKFSSSSSSGSTNSQTPWIIVICKQNIVSEGHIPIKLQCLQLLSSTVGKYFNKAQLFVSDVNDIILFCLSHPDISLQLHGAKLLDVLGRCMSNSMNTDLITVLEPSVSKLWQNVLVGPLINCLTNDAYKTLQSVCCDCLSTVSSKNFEKLHCKQQLMYVTVLLGLASDTNPNLRGAAIRCLGLYCLFPCLTQDISFLDDVSVILIKSVNDPNINVRLKASWSLGNLSDALFLNMDKFLLCKEISSQFFYSAGMASVEFSKDCDRVKANAVRALGNFLSYIPEYLINFPMMQEFVKESCEVLKSALTANLMKVCWNSCYALRNVLKNTNLATNNLVDLKEILTALLGALKSPNFKVRISAAQALSTMTSRMYYGHTFPLIWQHLVSAMFSISDDVNFKEIKHRENLCDQLCFSICQLAVIMTLEDIPLIAEDTLQAREMLLTLMWKFGSRATEEKNTTLCIAGENVSSLKAENTSNELDSFLMVLLDILNQAIIAFYGQDGC